MIRRFSGNSVTSVDIKTPLPANWIVGKNWMLELIALLEASGERRWLKVYQLTKPLRLNPSHFGEECPNVWLQFSLKYTNTSILHKFINTGNPADAILWRLNQHGTGKQWWMLWQNLCWLVDTGLLWYSAGGKAKWWGLRPTYECPMCKCTETTRHVWHYRYPSALEAWDTSMAQFRINLGRIENKLFQSYAVGWMLGKDINIYLPLKLGCLFLIVQFGHKKELGGIHFWKTAYLFTGDSPKTTICNTSNHHSPARYGQHC